MLNWPLNLVLKAKNAAVTNTNASFAYKKQLNGQVKSYDVAIVLCQLCFRNMPKLNKEHNCTCENYFHCETCTFCVKFLQTMFIPIRLENSTSVTLSRYNFTGLQFLNYVNWRRFCFCYNPMTISKYLSRYILIINT